MMHLNELHTLIPGGKSRSLARADCATTTTLSFYFLELAVEQYESEIRQKEKQSADLHILINAFVVWTHVPKQ